MPTDNFAQISPGGAARPLERMLSKTDVMAVLGVSMATLDRMRLRGAFPPAVRVSERRVAWRESLVREWLERRSLTSTAEAKAAGAK